MESPILQLAVAAGLGMLVGMQRERTARSAMGGVRTFTLITMAGCLAAMLASPLGGWTVAVGFAGVVAMIVVSNVMELYSRKKPDPGMTTEAASLVMFLVGAMTVTGPTGVPLVVTGLVVLLLHHKQLLHGIVRRMGDKEIRAIMQMVLIALVILPVLPNQEFGPLKVLNPYNIWLMVVLIVGISLAAYMAVKLLGEKVGALLAGVLGGLISSTATSVSYARKTREAPAASGLAAAIILIASCIVFGRILVEASVVAPNAMLTIAPPLLAVAGFIGVLGAIMFFTHHHDASAMPLRGEPSELKTAIIFAALYAVILFAVAFVKEKVGESGLYVVAVVSGLTDMDAITLSTANLIAAQRLDPNTGWRIILVAAMANIVFKGGAVMMLGAPALRRKIGLFFALALLGAAAVLVFWPGAPGAAPVEAAS